MENYIPDRLEETQKERIRRSYRKFGEKGRNKAELIIADMEQRLFECRRNVDEGVDPILAFESVLISTAKYFCNQTTVCLSQPKVDHAGLEAVPLLKKTGLYFGYATKDRLYAVERLSELVSYAEDLVPFGDLVEGLVCTFEAEAAEHNFACWSD